MFPEIKTLEDLKSKVSHLPEINFSVNELGYTVACYSISTGETFTGENYEFARECRGITFGPDGKIVARPLHKFFNIGELPETLAHVIDWGDIVAVMDKRDGSMVHPILLGDKLILKTKKSFTSDVALLATKVLHSNSKFAQHVSFCKECCRIGKTPIFEFTTPEWRIVLPYAENDLRLLHVRDNITGEYEKDAVEFAKSLGFDEVLGADCFDVEKFSAASLQEMLETLTDVEGFIFKFSNGNMVKGKTQWYLNLHRTVTFVRERDVAEMVANETVDDFKSFLSATGAALDKVIEIEHRVLEEFRQIEREVNEAFNEIKDMASRKEAAMKLKGHKFFHAAMVMYNGKEFDIKEHFLKYILREKFSLTQI